MNNRVLGALVASGLVAIACGGGGATTVVAAAKQDVANWPKDDKSMCAATLQGLDPKAVEMQEVAGGVSIRPNVRRVYLTRGDRDHRQRTLLCREIDTNLDGLKDIARWFDDKGLPTLETADVNFDGTADTWLTYVEGRLAEQARDTNKDGKADNSHVFDADGRLSKVRIDRNFDGKDDEWFVYGPGGSLERVGFDDDFDGRVDRWERDEVLLRREQEAEAKELAQADAKKAAEAASTEDAGPPSKKKK